MQTNVSLNFEEMYVLSFLTILGVCFRQRDESDKFFPSETVLFEVVLKH